MFAIKSKGKKAGEIVIYEDVGEGFFGGVSAKTFADELKKISDVETIDVRINSYGGDVFDGLAIYRLLAEHKARVIVHVDGIAASIASVIAMAGQEIHVAESGFIMIHDAWGGAMGNASDLRKYADTLEAASDQIASVYVARTGMKAEAVRELMREETWLNASDAIANGFATHVAPNLRVAAYGGKFDVSRYRRMPANAAPTPEHRASAEDRAMRAKHLLQAARISARKESRGAG